MAAGAFFGIVTPASAAPGEMTITNVNMDNTSLQPGSQTTLSFTIKGAPAPGSGETTITITSSLAPDVTVKINGCTSGTCSFVNTFNADASKDYSVTVIAAQNPTGVGAGQQKSGSIKIQADPTNGASASKSQSITLQGAATQAPAAAIQLTGFVKDVATGAAISGATVTLQDSAAHNFTTTTNNLGAFSFKSTQIAPGTLAVGAQKAGYKDATASANVQAGQSYAFPTLQLESTAPATPTDGASAPVVPPPPADTISVAPLGQDSAGNEGGSGFSTMLIVAGALLVLLGIGAIVLIVVRRRRDDGEGLEDDEDGAPYRRGPTPVPAGRGSYRGAPDATSVARGGGYDDPTMVRRGSPLSEAPTTMQRPVPPVDEYPDPYGAPPPRSPQPHSGGYDGGQYGGGGGYGANNYGGYDDRRGGDYGSGAPPYGGIYGQPEEPTRGYDPAGYDSPAPRSPGGYDSPAPRSPGGYGANNYGGGSGSGYSSGGGGHDGGYQPQRGYDQPTSGGGYRDSGGYGGSRGGGYPPADEYDQPRGGYDSGQPRRGSQPPPDSRGGRLDWLDD